MATTRLTALLLLLAGTASAQSEWTRDAVKALQLGESTRRAKAVAWPWGSLALMGAVGPGPSALPRGVAPFGTSRRNLIADDGSCIRGEQRPAVQSGL